MTIAPDGWAEEFARARTTLASFAQGLQAGRARVGLPPVDAERDLSAPGRAGASDLHDRVAHDPDHLDATHRDVIPLAATPEVTRLAALATSLGLRAPSAATSHGHAAGDVVPARAAAEIGLLVGLAHPYDPMAGLVAAVVEAVEAVEAVETVRATGAEAAGDAAGGDRADHVAAVIDVAAAAAVAAGVSCGVDAAAPEQRLALSAWAADDAADRSSYRPGPQLSARLTWACALAERSEGDPVDVLALLVGNSAAPQECVPAGFALAATQPDVLATRDAALALGGQADVIAAVAGALRAGTAVSADGARLPEGAAAGVTDAGGPDAGGPDADGPDGERADDLGALAADLLAHRATVLAGAPRLPRRFGATS